MAQVMDPGPAQRSSSPKPLGGIVCVDKPKGLSSNQVLGRIKRLYGIKKAGHTGTLDPMATGLLVVCLGYATRMCAHLMDADKAYEARVHLGVSTDTEDAEGEVIEQKPITGIDAQTIEAVLAEFIGPIKQIPPMYSALKQQGQRLYDLARQGQVVERPPRDVRIDALSLNDLHLDDPNRPGFSFRVDCSKGTYVRALVRDIGERLGCGAHLCALRRIKADPFDISQARSLDEFEAASEALRDEWLLPINQAVPDWPVIALSDEHEVGFFHGRAIPVDADIEQAIQGALSEGAWVCVQAKDAMIGLAEVHQGQLQPRAVFV